MHAYMRTYIPTHAPEHMHTHAHRSMDLFTATGKAFIFYSCSDVMFAHTDAIVEQ